MITPSQSDLSHLHVQARELKVTAVTMAEAYPLLWPWTLPLVMIGLAAEAGVEVLRAQGKATGTRR